MPEYTKKIVYLSDAQYQELITNKSITVNGVTVNYDKNMIYMTPQNTPLYAEDLAEWAKASTKPNYTAVEVGALPSDTHIPITTAELTNDAGFITSADLPTKVSDLTDDSGHYTKPTTGIPASDLEEEIVSTIDGKAPAIWKDANGSIAHFEDGADDMPLRECMVQIDPVQDLHGYDHPWPAGGGRNLLPPLASQTLNGVTLTSSNGVVTLNGTATQDTYFDVYINLPVAAGQQVYFRAWNPVAGTTKLTLFLISTAGNPQINMVDINSAYDFVSSADSTISRLRLRCPSGYALNNFVVKPMLQIGGTQPEQFEPYSNICPITGWTGVTISHSGADTADPDEISITFPTEAGTVYGGTLDVTNGMLTVDRAKITLDGTQMIGISNWRPYNGSSAWLYTPNTTPGRINTMGKIGAICDLLKEIPYGSSDAPSGTPYIYGGECGISSVGSNLYGLAVRVPVSGLTNNSLINAWLNDNPITVVYPLSTPIIYQLTPQEIRTLLGTNNIWADTGDAAVTYPVDTKMFVEQNTPNVPVQDVQVNGTSILSNGVANVPIGNVNGLGVVKVRPIYGINAENNGDLILVSPSESEIKTGTGNSRRAIQTYNQHIAAFYGLAKAAGDTTQSQSLNSVGDYTDNAKEKIQSMLGISQMLGPENSNLIASQAYAIGDIFTANGKLYKATAAIVKDGAIIPETNCVETSLADVGGNLRDVQVNGTSIISNGIANIPHAGYENGIFGVVSVGNFSASGLEFSKTGLLRLSGVSNEYVKAGQNYRMAITPSHQHVAAFYGLSKVAGVDLANETVTLGTYPDNAKTAIRTMIGASSTSVIAIQDTQPTDTDTKIWLPETAETPVQIPTMDDLGNYVQKTDIATESQAGIIKPNSEFGIGINFNSQLYLNRAELPQIKAGTELYRPIVPNEQHKSVFYGLAKAAGDATQAASSNAVGTYTEEAKSAIQTMLGVPGDVQVNGTSVISNGVANVQMSTTERFGVMKFPYPNSGLQGDPSGYLKIAKANSAQIKEGIHTYTPIVPASQHESTFYGLAKAAGDTTMTSSSNAVGQYTDEAKSAIQSMLGIDLQSIASEVEIPLVETVEGTAVTITGQPNTRYMCGEVTSISITPPAAGSIDVVFTSGSTVAVLTLPSTVKMPGWFDTSTLDTNTVYEILIIDGVYGSVMTWQA